MYLPKLESLRAHPLPTWYQDAKFGIFIHWTISSVPAFAPTGEGDIGQLFKKKSQAYTYAHQPYAEWYQNSLRIPGSPVQAYHRKTYGPDYAYQNFAGTFNQLSRGWDPNSWADLFQRAGARYVVLVSKHHDGFLLWNSQFANPFVPGYRTERDVTGELSAAVSARGMKMGLYYSSALDWTFTKQPILDFADLLSSGPTSAAYARYVENHLHELIDRYQPWALWSDIGYPSGSNLLKIFAYFYNHNPEGVVNDRWYQLNKWLFTPPGKLILKLIANRIMNSGGTSLPRVPHCDFRTAEYMDVHNRMPYKWESVRGIGNSFTYNQFETADDYLKAPDLIRMLADVVSKNGNLLLNVGPRADGSLPDPQSSALEGLGRWLSANGQAIYGTRPFSRSGDRLEDGTEIRYTCKDGHVFLIFLKIAGRNLSLPDLPLRLGSRLTLLETGQELAWQHSNGRLRFSLPENISAESIPVLQAEFAAPVIF